MSTEGRWTTRLGIGAILLFSSSSPATWAARRGRRRVPARPAAGPRPPRFEVKIFGNQNFKDSISRTRLPKIRILEIESLKRNP
ncbi:hypothetical protein M2189_002772 [Bradyrhizobium japonicum]|uniref:hypothetical protein n=1 Tax=Bradyrhizobium japonicum TaxID=375 RepID=UPI002169B49C|nr:hypothetical protein [Bradyrhizobium japonicum]MCS3498270.1 hypothetical protein [Bradyrhizobium japonicum]MCS3959569.1 hypothetical protein [Bradyrhizobium japonicum]MCS4001323.1 hypothetical protein [Bradyrhizobium japonicum]